MSNLKMSPTIIALFNRHIFSIYTCDYYLNYKSLSIYYFHNSTERKTHRACWLLGNDDDPFSDSRSVCALMLIPSQKLLWRFEIALSLKKKKINASRATSSTCRKNIFRKRFCLLFTRTNSRANADCVALRFGQLVRVTTRPDAHVFYRSFRPRKHAVTLPHLWNCVLSLDSCLLSKLRKRELYTSKIV